MCVTKFPCLEIELVLWNFCKLYCLAIGLKKLFTAAKKNSPPLTLGICNNVHLSYAKKSLKSAKISLLNAYHYTETTRSILRRRSIMQLLRRRSIVSPSHYTATTTNQLSDSQKFSKKRRYPPEKS